MADETINPNGDGDQQRQDAAEGLHIHGRGHDALEDGAEQPAEPAQQHGSEDVFGNANVQSGRRSTYEGMIDGQPDPGETVADQSPVVGGEYTPQDPDGAVRSAFDAVQPQNARTTGRAPNGEQDEGEDAADEEGQRDPILERPEDRLFGDEDGGGAPTNPPPTADPAATAFAATQAPGETDGEPDDGTGGGEDEQEPNAETPTVTAANAAGVEDEAVKLDLSAALTDVDGTETLTVTLSGLPDGFSLSDGSGAAVGTDLGGGTWSVPPAQLDDLYLVRPEHFSGDVPLTVTATATETNGRTSTTSTEFTVHVEAVADAPVLSVEDAAGTENQWHDLSISAALVDADGSESLTVYVTDVPDGATLDQGTRLSTAVTLADGTVLEAGTWVMTAAQAESVRILPPENDSADFTLRVFAETTEAMNGDRAVTGPAEINVDVGVVAPTVAGEGSGAEDEWIALDLSAGVNAELGDEGLQVLLEDLPENAVLRDSRTGEVLDTSQPLDISDRMDHLEVRWGEGTPMEHSDDEITFQLRAIVRDPDVGTDTETPRDTNQSTTTVTVNVTGVADPIALGASGTGNEDAFGGDIAVPVTIQLTDTDGSESLVDTIDLIFSASEQGVLKGYGVVGEPGPDGTTVYRVPVAAATFDAATGTYTLDGLTFDPATDSDVDVTFSVRATVEDSDGSRRTDTQDGQTITLNAVADAPIVAAEDTGGTEHAGGAADAGIEVDVTQLASTDDDTSESVTLYVGNVPDGATLTVNGVAVPTMAAADIDFTGVDTANAPAHGLTGTVYVLSGFDAATDVLRVQPADGSSKDFDLRLVAVADEENGTDQGNAVERNWSVADVHVDVGVLAPEITGTFTHHGTEQGDPNPDGWTALDGMQVTLPAASTALEEETVTITLRGADLADADMRVLDAGGNVVAEKADGADSFTVPASAWDPDTGTLSGLQVRWDDPDRSGTLSFILDAHVADQDMGTASENTAGEAYADEARTLQDVTVEIAPHVDTATVSASDTGTEDNGTPETAGDGFALTPEITLSGDDSEALTGDLVLTFTGDNATAGTVVWVPATGAPPAANPLSGGGTEYRLDTSIFTEGPDGKLVIDESKGSLRFVPVEHLAVPVSYGMAITVSDGEVTDTFTGTGEIAVDAVADPVSITASGAGNEDNIGTAISVPVSISLVDRDGSEDLTGTIDLIFDAGEKGVLTSPDGTPLAFTVSGGQKIYSISVDAGNVSNDGMTWTIDGLGFLPEQHSDEEVSFAVRATSIDSNGDTQETLSDGNVIDITAVADKVVIDAADTGAEEADASAGIPLDLSTALVDTDGSETLTLFITLPDGADERTVLLDKDGNEIAPADDLSQWSGTGVPDLTGTKTWAFTITSNGDTAMLDGLTLVPPEGVSDDIVLSLNAVTVEDAIEGDPRMAWTDTQEMRVDIGTSAPVLTVDGGSFSLLEGTARATAGNAWQGVDLASHLSVTLPLQDGGEALYVELYDLPSYVDVRYTDGSGNVVDPDRGDGTFRIPVESLSTVAFRMDAAHQDQNFTIKARALVHDADVGTDLETDLGEAFADSALGNEVTLSVTVLAQADKAGLSINGQGIEDTFRPLAITVNPKDGEAVTNIELTGIPDGMEIRVNGAAVTIVDGVADLSGYALSDLKNNLTFKAPLDASTYDSDNRLRLGLKVETTESGTEAGEVAAGQETYVTERHFNVRVWGDADTPTLDLNTGDGGGADDGGDAETPPTDGLEPTTFDHAISHIVLYLDDGTNPIFKVKIDNFSSGGTAWNDQHDPTDLPLDAFIEHFYEGSSLVALSVKAGNNKGSYDWQHNAEGEVLWTDGAVDDSLMPTGIPEESSEFYFATPNPAFDDLPEDTGGSGGSDGSGDTTTATSHTETIAEDDLFTLSLNGDDGLLQASTGEHGTDVDGVSADGSETLEFRITPRDGTHSRLLIDGEPQALSDDGSWIVSYDALANDRVQIGGVDDWHSDALTFDVTVVAVEADADHNAYPDALADGRQDGPTRQIILKITAGADAVEVISEATGLEDQPVTMPLAITLDDADGSESLVGHVYLVTSDANMTAGALSGDWADAASDLTFFNVALDADGKPVVDADGVMQEAVTDTGVYAVRIPVSAFTAPDVSDGEDTYTLPGLTFNPKDHSAEEIAYDIYATTEDANGSRHVTVGDGSVTLKAVADAPDVTVAGDDNTITDTTIIGNEDTYVPLQITAAAVDTDTESISHAELSGVPEGWSVGAMVDGVFKTATDKGNGTWDLDVGNLASVVVRAPLDAHTAPDETAGLTLRVTSREDGTDTSNAGDSDDGVAVGTAVTTKSFDVVIDAVADAPNLVVQPKVTAEEQLTKLDILPALKDTDGSEELAVFITGDLAGGALVARDGSPAAVEVAPGRWKVELDQLDDLYYDPAEDFSGTVDLQVIAQSTETESIEPTDDVATTTVDLPIIVRGVADALDSTDTITATATEGAGWFDPGLSELTTKDMVGAADDVGSESIAVVLKGLPDGVEVGMVAGEDDYLRYIGTTNGKPVWAVEAGHLDAIRLRVPEDWSGTLDVPLVVTVTEADGDSTATDMTLALDISPDADAPTVRLSGGGTEDHPGADGIVFTIKTGVGDADDRSNTEAVADQNTETVTGLALTFPEDQLAHMPDLTAVIDGFEYKLGTGGVLTIALPDGNITAVGGDLTVMLKGFPDGWSLDVPVSVTVEATEGDTTKTTTTEWSVPVAADADEPAIFDMAADWGGATAKSSATGSPIDLDLDVLLADTDGSEHAHVVVSGVANGMKLVDADGNTIGHDVGDGRWIVEVPNDTTNGHFLWIDGAPGTSASLNVTLIVTDIDPDGGRDVWDSVKDAATSFDVDVSFGTGGTGGGSAGDVEKPLVTMDDVQVDEDGSFLLAATVTAQGDGDVADSLIIHGLSNDVRVVSENGDFHVFALDNGNGTSDYVIPVDSIGNVRIYPPEDSAEDITLTITATARDGYWSRESDPIAPVVEVTPVTETAEDDGARLYAAVADGADTTEDSAGIGVTLTLKQFDADHSETLTSDDITLDTSSLPDGTTLAVGGWSWEADGTGSVTISLKDFGYNTLAEANAAFQSEVGLPLNGLTVTPPGNWHGELSLTASATVVDAGGGEVETWSGTVTIDVTPETDGATPTADDVSVNEDAAIPLNITIATTDLIGAGDHGSERLSVVIEGVPAGMTIVGASNNGSDDNGVTNTWTVKNSVLEAMGADGTLPGLHLVAPPDYATADGLHLTVRTYQFEAGTTDVVEQSDTFTVTITPDADTPFVTPQDVLGTEEVPVPLDLNAISSDFDGSETVSVRVTGAPQNATFTYTQDGASHTVTVGASGMVLLPITGVTALSFTGPVDASGAFTMEVTPIAKDGDDVAEGTAQSFTVSLTGDADAPTLITPAGGASGPEDTGIALNLSAQGSDTDGSESLDLVIRAADGADPIPGDTTLLTASGTTISLSADGTFSVPEGDITGLKLVPPTNWHGTLDLTVVARATEADGDTETVAQSLTVEVTARNDAPTVDVLAPDYSLSGNDGSEVRVLKVDSTDPLISFADVDADTDASQAVLSGLKISLASAEDTDGLGLSGLQIHFTSTGGLTTEVGGKTFDVSWDGPSHTLTFSGEGSYADYQTLAEAVILTNDGGTMTAGSRTVSFAAIDGTGAESSDTGGGFDTDVQISIGDSREVVRAADDLHFRSDGRASITGTDGDDALEISPDVFGGISGGGGFDILTVMSSAGQAEDWTFAVAEDGSVSATNADGSHSLDIVFEDDTGAQVDEAGDLLLDQDSAGYVVFDEDESSRIDFEGIDKING